MIFINHDRVIIRLHCIWWEVTYITICMRSSVRFLFINHLSIRTVCCSSSASIRCFLPTLNALRVMVAMAMQSSSHILSGVQRFRAIKREQIASYLAEIYALHTGMNLFIGSPVQLCGSEIITVAIMINRCALVCNRNAVCASRSNGFLVVRLLVRGGIWHNILFICQPNGRLFIVDAVQRCMI